MPNIRISECEVGTIVHRPDTLLLPPCQCLHGHFLPRYVSRRCVACARINVLMHGPPLKRAQNRMKYFSNYEVAQQAWFERGGWLLNFENNIYGVTDNPSAVQRLRGADWVLRCDQLECLDETALVNA